MNEYVVICDDCPHKEVNVFIGEHVDRCTCKSGYSIEVKAIKALDGSLCAIRHLSFDCNPQEHFKIIPRMVRYVDLIDMVAVMPVEPYMARLKGWTAESGKAFSLRHAAWEEHLRKESVKDLIYRDIDKIEKRKGTQMYGNGAPAVVRAQNIMHKKKGSRQTMHFRNDSVRGVGVSDKQLAENYGRINYNEPPVSGMKKVETRKGEKVITRYVKEG